MLQPELVTNRAITEESTQVKRDELGRWLPGQSPNPSGRPKRDEAAIIARQAIEENAVEIVKALAEKLKAGDINAFTALAERGYGKMPQTSVHTGDVDLNVTDKRTRLAEVLTLLGDAS